MRILFIDTVHPILQSLLEADQHVCVDGSMMSRQEILKSIQEYDGIIIRSRINIDKEILDAATGLKFIARAGAGMESIDLKYAEVKKISCLNSPEGSRDAVGEHAVGMLLSLLNNLHRADREVRDGKWNREGNRGVELHGKTVGIIGYGNMGKAFAQKISGFGCHSFAFDKYLKNFSDQFAKEVSIDELFDKTDILSLHVPLTSETMYLVNDAFISRFRKNIYLVNTARGKVVKTDDLVSHMKTGKISGACLDTLEYEETSFEELVTREPGTRDNDSLSYLIQSPNTVLSPHIAGWTHESNEKIAQVLYEKIKAQ